MDNSEKGNHMMRDVITRSELDAALPFVLDAPKMETKVALLCLRPVRNQREFPAELRFTVKDGVVGDYGMTSPWLTLPDGTADPRIHVSILPQRVLDLVWYDPANVTFPGDTIVADFNVTLENLPVGTRLQVEDAELEVTNLWNEGCAKWKVRFGREAYGWTSAPEHEALRLRGIYCQIVKNGTVRIGDTLRRL